jgi:hypothetical protein
MMEYNEENMEKLKKKPPRQQKFSQAVTEIEQNMEFDNNLPQPNPEEVI